MYVFPGGRVDEHDHSQLYAGYHLEPVGRPRRFDTRFFITATPEAQSGLHDGKETIDSCWISPKKALQLHASNEFGMMRVTAMQLREFENYKTAAEFLDMLQMRFF